MKMGCLLMNIVTLTVLPILVFLTTCSADDEVIFSIEKNLETARVTDVQGNFQVTINEPNVTISFETTYKTAPNIREATVYFANNARSILEVKIEPGLTSLTHYQTPYNVMDQQQMENDIANNEVFLNGGAIMVDLAHLPRHTTLISASMVYNVTEELVTLNYYGLHNFPLSLPDRWVVENYKKVNFTEFTADTMF